MLIAEDLLLLLTDDETGKLAAASDQVDLALGGALLVELALAGRVAAAGEGDRVRAGRLVVRDAGPTADPLLDEALAGLAAREGKKAKDVVASLGKGLRGRLYARLAERGILHEESGRALGIFPTHRWPSVDAAHEGEVRARIAQALRNGAAPDEPTAALIALLHALKAVGKVVDAAAVGLAPKEVRDRAASIAAGDWASDAVRKAIEELSAMLLAAVAASSTSAAISQG